MVMAPGESPGGQQFPGDDPQVKNLFSLNGNRFIGDKYKMEVPMDDPVSREILGHLQMIEQAYGVFIDNKEEIITLIWHATRDRREILTIALALNNHVAVHGLSGRLTIPKERVEQMIAAIVGRW
jgi:hypothetical protein